MNTAIIVAAGSGQRFDRSRPKQFVDILGKPLIIHTLERFEACSTIDEIVLVLSDAGREAYSSIGSRFPISKLKTIVRGGKTRADSVRNGLDEIEAAGARVVAVHDGARPLVTTDEIAGTVECAAEIGAACLVGKVNDTIKETHDGLVSRTIDRAALRRALTPQAFRYEILRRAFEDVELDDSITDECCLVERLNVPIAIVEGGSQNIKITHESDLLLAESLLTKIKCE